MPAQKQGLADMYKSRGVTKLTLGFRQLFSQGTVAGNVLTLSKDSSYTLQTCGGLSRGKYHFGDKKLSLYQHFYVPHRSLGADSATTDTLLYLQKPDGILVSKTAGYFFKNGQKKRVTLLDELVPEK